MINFIRKLSVSLETSSGAALGDCVYEAIRVAMDERCDVTFTHNDEQYVVEWSAIDSLHSNVYNQH